MEIIIELPHEIWAKKENIMIRLKQGKHTGVSATISVDGSAKEELNTKKAVTLENAQGMGLGTYVHQLCERFEQAGQYRIAETYACALRSFLRFKQEDDVCLCQMDKQMMALYEKWMRDNNLTVNTISFYMRILRAVYNRAVDEGLVEDAKPFGSVYTGHAKTLKRAVTIDVIRQLQRMDALGDSEEMARQLFLFSFYTRGMSFVDIAHLKKSDIRNGYLIYNRKKTGQRLRVAWRKCMQAIVDQFPSRDGVHLLGILDGIEPLQLRKQYRACQAKLNHALKQIGHLMKIPTPLTMYVARHSWATIARQLHVPMGVISDGMGHHSEQTTQIYLKSIDAELIDQANDQLIQALEQYRSQ